MAEVVPSNQKSFHPGSCEVPSKNNNAPGSTQEQVQLVLQSSRVEVALLDYQQQLVVVVYESRVVKTESQYTTVLVFISNICVISIQSILVPYYQYVVSDLSLSRHCRLVYSKIYYSSIRVLACMLQYDSTVTCLCLYASYNFTVDYYDDTLLSMITLIITLVCFLLLLIEITTKTCHNRDSKPPAMRKPRTTTLLQYYLV